MKAKDYSQIDETVGTGTAPPPTSSRAERGDLEPSSDEIARKAYFLHLDHGRPQGQDRQDWFEAESMIRAERNTSRQNLRATA